jgi:N-acetylglucosaminyldiphosphoundecaprenol N-acetyl-beta-D-mannosaminyltransferase
MVERPAMRVCGVRIDALDADQAADLLLSRVGEHGAVHLCNAFTLSLATQDPGFGALLDRGDVNLPDGMPLVWIARRLGLCLAARAYGPDVMAGVLDRGRATGLRHYLYGSTPEVLQALRTEIGRRWPGVTVVGAESPPFRTLTGEEEQALVERLAAAGPDIVWVGLGTPGQDHFVDRFRDRVRAPLVAVGAAFDFHAGAKRQAPRILQRAGLEWAFRLATEPRRLWRRYLVGNTRFVVEVLRSRPAVVACPSVARR